MMAVVRVRFYSFLIVLVLLVSCQATPPPGKESGAPTADASTSSPWTEITRLADRGSYKEAALAHERALRAGEAAVVGAKSPEQAELLKRIAQGLNESFAGSLRGALTRLNRYLDKPAEPAEWPELKAELKEADALMREYGRFALVKAPGFRAHEAEKLERLLKKVRTFHREKARVLFRQFDLFSEADFFEAFPVPLPDPRGFLELERASLLKRLARGTPDQIRDFRKRYPLEGGLLEEVSGLFVERSLPKRAKSGSKADRLAAILKLGKELERDGFEPGPVKGLKIAFIEATSRTLLKRKHIDFAASIDVDLPVEIIEGNLRRDLFADKEVDFTVILDVGVAKIDRKMKKKKVVRSTYRTGVTEKGASKEYEAAHLKEMVAKKKVREAKSQRCGFFVTGILGGCVSERRAKYHAAAAEWREAKAAKAKIPRFVELNVTEPYEFDTFETRTRKTLFTNFYVIDHRKRTYYKSDFTAKEMETFKLAANMKRDDDNYNQLVERYDLESDIDDFEQAPMRVKLSSILTHYIRDRKSSKRFRDGLAFREEIMRDKNTLIADWKKNYYNWKPQNDPRFHSVVAIYARGRGAIGSGFYIAPDLVLTNYHVVDEGLYFPVKGWDKLETTGKVVHRDVRLDLALLKVGRRGRPVRFYEKNTIDLGATLDLLGHPRGEEFTITRGVISSLRKLRSINFQDYGKKQFGEKVLHIQTDAAANPGNSGGPAFLGDRVVGVLNWGYSKEFAEGLSFIIHYAEVKRFLEDDFQ